jgi:hypothetical protein
MYMFIMPIMVSLAALHISDNCHVPEVCDVHDQLCVVSDLKKIFLPSVSGPSGLKRIVISNLVNLV